MGSWEYKVLSLKEIGYSVFSTKKNIEKVSTALNELGRQGWELVQMSVHDAGTSGIAAVLKRRRS